MSENLKSENVLWLECQLYDAEDIVVKARQELAMAENRHEQLDEARQACRLRLTLARRILRGALAGLDAELDSNP
jgi:hypothetical protein